MHWVDARPKITGTGDRPELRGFIGVADPDRIPRRAWWTHCVPAFGVIAAVAMAIAGCTATDRSTAPPATPAAAEIASAAPASEAGSRDRFDRFAEHMDDAYARLEAVFEDHTAALESGDTATQYGRASQMHIIARAEIDWLNRHKAEEVADECWYRAWSHWFHSMLNLQAAAAEARTFAETSDVAHLDEFASFIGLAGDYYDGAMGFRAEAVEDCA